MISATDVNRLTGADVYDADGDRIGSAGQVYLDDRTGAPEWVTVHTGLFGHKESFVPLHRATFASDRLVVPFDKKRVKHAPRIDPDGDLDTAQEDELYSHYGLSSTGGRLSGDADGQAATGSRHRDTDDAMTRSEERLTVDTERDRTGQARLRKYVVTERQQVQVPVAREEVRLEREPVTDANRGSALAGPDIAENEHEVTLHAERPVVDTEAVPVERVRLGKETVTDERTVSGQVRKEHIEADLPDRGRRDLS